MIASSAGLDPRYRVICPVSIVRAAALDFPLKRKFFPSSIG